jgi:shikimate kinase
MFIIGPKACGKTTVAKAMAKRTNMKHIDFCDFLSSNGLED